MTFLLRPGEHTELDAAPKICLGEEMEKKYPAVKVISVMKISIQM
jgi:hypothetical protein